ncbi:protein of unknown function [Moritella yayanosii]|uniref:Uncharacterized protein n=1 Tax=Moritella yayanosii TaxID=69539 RepID=A0A330LXC9_9GAMM|nr:protein of unknown function [Moritella yayanosii]
MLWLFGSEFIIFILLKDLLVLIFVKNLLIVILLKVALKHDGYNAHDIQLTIFS